MASHMDIISLNSPALARVSAAPRRAPAAISRAAVYFGNEFSSPCLNAVSTDPAGIAARRD
eukprot:5812152-Pyramimonas_sp.AAC.1